MRPSTRTVHELLGEQHRCLTPLEQLIESLLWEGYALYPYTPTATKNATPTPFGIVYPPTYASGSSSTFDHLELRCVLESPTARRCAAEVRFLAAQRPPPRGDCRRRSRSTLCSVAAVADAPRSARGHDRRADARRAAGRRAAGAAGCSR